MYVLRKQTPLLMSLSTLGVLTHLVPHDPEYIVPLIIGDQEDGVRSFMRILNIG